LRRDRLAEQGKPALRTLQLVGPEVGIEVRASVRGHLAPPQALHERSQVVAAPGELRVADGGAPVWDGQRQHRAAGEDGARAAAARRIEALATQDQPHLLLLFGWGGAPLVLAGAAPSSHDRRRAIKSGWLMAR